MVSEQLESHLKQVSKGLKEAVRKSGMTAAYLSNKTGVSECQISKYMNGHADPRLSTVVRLCEGMQITPNELLGIYSATAYAAVRSEEKLLRMLNGVRRAIHEYERETLPPMAGSVLDRPQLGRPQGSGGEKLITSSGVKI